MPAFPIMAMLNRKCSMLQIAKTTSARTALWSSQPRNRHLQPDTNRVGVVVAPYGRNSRLTARGKKRPADSPVTRSPSPWVPPVPPRPFDSNIFLPSFHKIFDFSPRLVFSLVKPPATGQAPREFERTVANCNRQISKDKLSSLFTDTATSEQSLSNSPPFAQYGYFIEIVEESFSGQFAHGKR
jgi:hypothetical protein